MNSLRLPLSRGPLAAGGDGIVNIRPSNAAWRTVYPFAQPQPYFERTEGDSLVTTLTTNGVSLLRAVMGNTSHNVLVRADLDLLCALLITPDAMTLGDVNNFRVGRDDRLIMIVEERPRFGLPENSCLVFHWSYGIEIVDRSYLDEEMDMPPLGWH